MHKITIFYVSIYLLTHRSGFLIRNIQWVFFLFFQFFLADFILFPWFRFRLRDTASGRPTYLDLQLRNLVSQRFIHASGSKTIFPVTFLNGDLISVEPICDDPRSRYLAAGCACYHGRTQMLIFTKYQGNMYFNHTPNFLLWMTMNIVYFKLLFLIIYNNGCCGVLFGNVNSMMGI